MAIRRCVYCGGQTLGRLACRAHVDLLALDPHYAPEIRQTTTAHWEPEKKAAA